MDTRNSYNVEGIKCVQLSAAEACAFKLLGLRVEPSTHDDIPYSGDRVVNGIIYRDLVGSAMRSREMALIYSWLGRIKLP